MGGVIYGFLSLRASNTLCSHLILVIKSHGLDILISSECDNKRRMSANKGRHLAERHLKTCIHAGIKVTETSQRNAVTWSYKLGPMGGLDLADELWMSRFLMLRVRLPSSFILIVSFSLFAAMFSLLAASVLPLLLSLRLLLLNLRLSFPSHSARRFLKRNVSLYLLTQQL